MKECKGRWGLYIWFFCPVTHSRSTLCDPMDCSTQAFPVHHQLPGLTQTHVLWLDDAIQPSHPLSSLLILPSIFPSISVFSNESILCIRWPKYWSFSFSISPSNEHSGLTSFRIDWFELAVQGTHSQKCSPTPQFKSINSMALSFLYGPTLTSIHDYWENHQIRSDQLLSHVWLCDPMNRSTPGLPVHHQLLEFTETHVHWVSDAIQPSHPLS